MTQFTHFARVDEKMEPLVQTRHRPLGIVAALHDELHELLAATQNKLRHRIGGREFWIGELQGHRVVLVQCRVGKVAAAATTVALISHFHVRAVVLTGVAGGIAPHVAVDDVVISTQLLQHDVDASPLFPRWEVPLTGLSRFPSDPALTQDLAKSAGLVLADLGTLLSPRIMQEFAIHEPKVHAGLIVSGDRFVATTQECQVLRNALPEALAVEMEGAAVAHGVPRMGCSFCCHPCHLRSCGRLCRCRLFRSGLQVQRWCRTAVVVGAELSIAYA